MNFTVGLGLPVDQGVGASDLFGAASTTVVSRVEHSPKRVDAKLTLALVCRLQTFIENPQSDFRISFCSTQVKMIKSLELFGGIVADMIFRFCGAKPAQQPLVQIRLLQEISQQFP